MEPWLAAAHYLAIFVTFALLLGEFVLLRLEPTGPGIKLLSRLDIGYGVFAGVVIATGLARVFWGEIPAPHWASNGLFWAKMAVFGVVGALSVPPTLRILSWSKSLEANGRLPEVADRKRVALFVHIELGLLVLIPFLAVFMGQ